MAQKTKASGSHSVTISDFAKNFSLLSSPDCSCGILHTALSVSHTSQANINSESPQSVTSTIVFSKCQSQLFLAFTKKPLTDLPQACTSNLHSHPRMSNPTSHSYWQPPLFSPALSKRFCQLFPRVTSTQLSTKGEKFMSIVNALIYASSPSASLIMKTSSPFVSLKIQSLQLLLFCD